MNGIRIILLALFLGSALLSAKSLEVIGSTTCQNVFLLPTSTAFKEKTGIDLVVKGIGSVKGIIGLVKGDASVSAISEALPMAVASAQLMSPNLAFPTNFQFHEITKDKIVVIANAANKVNFLSSQQLTDIFNGNLRDWKEVNGKSGKIQPVINRRGSGTEDAFYRAVMNDGEYGDNVVKTTNTRTIIRSVSRDKNAIGIASEKLVKGNHKVKILKSREIARRLGLVTIGKPKKDAQVLIDFLKSKDAQKLF